MGGGRGGAEVERGGYREEGLYLSDDEVLVAENISQLKSMSMHTWSWETAHLTPQIHSPEQLAPCHGGLVGSRAEASQCIAGVVVLFVDAEGDAGCRMEWRMENGMMTEWGNGSGDPYV